MRLSRNETLKNSRNQPPRWARGYDRIQFNSVTSIAPKSSKMRAQRRRIFLNEVTVLAVLKLTRSEFQEEGAATAKAIGPHFVRKRGAVNIFVLEDLSSLEFLIKQFCVGLLTR